MDEENKGQDANKTTVTTDATTAATTPAAVLAKEPSLGVWLKEQRLKKKISLEEIAAVTKIHIAQLRNIEEDHTSSLPAPAFVRGFLVSYARHLNLDENEVITRFRNTLGEKTSLEDPSILMKGNRAARSSSEPRVKMVGTPTFTQSAASKNLDPEKNPLANPKLILILVAGLALIIAIIYFISVGEKSKKLEASKSAVVEVQKPSELAVPPVAVPPVLKAPAPAPAPVAAPTPVVVAPPAVVPAKNAAKSPGLSPENAVTKKYQLELKSLEQSWVNVRLDDGNSQGMQLKSGSLNNFQAERRIVLSLSDAGAVEIKWNGNWYAAPGFRGDVKSLTLPDELASLSPKLAAKTPRPKAAAPAAATTTAPAATPVPANTQSAGH